MKKSNSVVKREERPSTAPSKESKEKENQNKYYFSNNNSFQSQNRLPSPQIKRKFINFIIIASNPTNLARGSSFERDQAKKQGTTGGIPSAMNNVGARIRGNSNPAKSTNYRMENSSSFKGSESKYKI